MTIRILAVDPSLAATGFALLEHEPVSGGWSAQTWTRGRSGRRKESLVQRDERISLIVAELHTFGRVDAAAIESPAFGAPGGSTWDRAGLWWQIVHRLMHLNIAVTEINSATRKKFATGRGGSIKNPVDKADIAMAATRMWPGVEIHGNNEADALVLASVLAVRLGLPVPFEVHAYRKDAVAKVELPEARAA